MKRLLNAGPARVIILTLITHYLKILMYFCGIKDNRNI
jgi:hypothetical protein